MELKRTLKRKKIIIFSEALGVCPSFLDSLVDRNKTDEILTRRLLVLLRKEPFFSWREEPAFVRAVAFIAKIKYFAQAKSLVPPQGGYGFRAVLV